MHDAGSNHRLSIHAISCSLRPTGVDSGMPDDACCLTAICLNSTSATSLNATCELFSRKNRLQRVRDTRATAFGSIFLQGMSIGYPIALSSPMHDSVRVYTIYTTRRLIGHLRFLLDCHCRDRHLPIQLRKGFLRHIFWYIGLMENFLYRFANRVADRLGK